MSDEDTPKWLPPTSADSHMLARTIGIALIMGALGALAAASTKTVCLYGSRPVTHSQFDPSR